MANVSFHSKTPSVHERLIAIQNAEHMVQKDRVNNKNNYTPLKAMLKSHP
jgi:hypothetical protein